MSSLKGTRAAANHATMRRMALDAHLFSSFSQVRDLVHDWMISCNEERPHAPSETSHLHSSVRT